MLCETVRITFLVSTYHAILYLLQALFSGSSNLPLAEEISYELRIPLSKVQLGRFADGEVSVQVGFLCCLLLPPT